MFMRMCACSHAHTLTDREYKLTGKHILKKPLEVEIQQEVELYNDNAEALVIQHQHCVQWPGRTTAVSYKTRFQLTGKLLAQR